ncbi:MAG: CAP domain-containing protein [Acidobacteria bacterium]|nr:CAP domain-containing protein [Acidobacteriota bacterium]
MCLSVIADRHAAPIADGASTVVAQINQYRSLAGLAPVELDASLSQGCREHASYLVRNSKSPSVRELGAHAQSPDLPGYTEAGARAARNSVISFSQSPEGCVSDWLATFYHRAPLLRPNLKRVGVGKEGAIVVADVVTGLEGEENTSVAYPADGQTQVPTEFGDEIPHPAPPNAPRPAGYPITPQFPPFGPQAAGVKAELTDAAGKSVAFHLSDPERPATFFTQQNTICLIPLTIGILVENERRHVEDALQESAAGPIRTPASPPLILLNARGDPGMNSLPLPIKFLYV